MPSDLIAQPAPPDFTRRARLTEMMDEPCSPGELRACLRDLARLNRWFLSDRPLLHWLAQLPRSTQPLRVLDVGCGDGEPLRRIARWARARNMAIELTGLDINPGSTAIAAELTPPGLAIEWVAADIFTYEPRRPVDLVISSLVTHHLTESQIVAFLQWMECHARLGWFINDLSRAAVPYHFLRIFTRLARLHPFVQHDAPVSVARAFVHQDWQSLCAAAGFSMNDVAIEAWKPAHLCVSRRKPK